MSQNRLTIFGAGMAGLIAARMLADRKPLVMERQREVPNNHHAVLRFRSSVVGDVTNIPFRRVTVSKFVLSEHPRNPIRDAINYSRKVTGKLHARSIIDTRPSDRFIAPKDFISRLASTAEVKFNVEFRSWSHNLVREHGPIISTIPVPAMMEMFGWQDQVKFVKSSGWTIKAWIDATLDCSLYGTIYSARKVDSWYRASLTGEEIMIEGVGEAPDASMTSEILSSVLGEFGIEPSEVYDYEVYPSKYQKIGELASKDRESVKRFIMWMSSEHQIYSLGRFATWRPKLLLDDLVNDVRVISRLIDGESNYNETLKKKA